MCEKYFLLSLVALFTFGCKTADDPTIDVGTAPCAFTGFYYYKGEPLRQGEMSADYILIGCDTLNNEEGIRELVASKIYFDKNMILQSQSMSITNTDWLH